LTPSTPLTSNVDGENTATPSASEPPTPNPEDSTSSKQPSSSSTTTTTTTTPAASSFHEAATPRPEPEHQRTAKATLGNDFTTWEVGSRYKLQRILGHGSYGEVAQAEDNQRKEGEPQYVAIKRINGIFDQEIDAKRIYREMYILRRLRSHGSIIR